MSSNEVPAIVVKDVSKNFKIPLDKNSGIKQLVVNFYKRRKGYREFKALNNISFEIKKGEFFGIVGRNGSGKSTLLKILAGTYVPDNGGIQVNGSLIPFIELGVGFNPELTGRENIFLNGALLGFSKKEIETMYDEIVDFAELHDFMEERLKNYSSGMQVRLAFSIAIRAKSDILVLDEVLAVGDAAFQKKCYDYFMLLKRNKRTVVLVTHDMEAVRRYCDRGVMLDAGSITKTGRPEEIAQAYQKLFTEEMISKDDSKSKNKDKNHWGNGKMQCLVPELEVGKDEITLKCSYKALGSLPAPIFGFTIYGPTGVNILEGNTKRSKQKTFDMKKGEIVKVEWVIPNVFTGGVHNISVAACDQSTIEFYDWFNEANSFNIAKGEQTAGIVDPEIKINSLKVAKG